MSQVPTIFPPGELYDPSDMQFFTGMVREIDGPAGFGAAADYSYATHINFPDNPSVVEGIAPVCQRWAGNVVPIEVGTPVIVASVRGHLQMMWREIPHIVDCGGSPVNSELALIATVQAMSAAGRSKLRRLLESA